MVREVPEEDRVKVANAVAINTPEGVIYIAVATVDHVIPIEYGGDSEVDNLVLACKHCNNWRSNPPKMFPYEYSACAGCGVMKRKPTLCRSCRRLVSATVEC